MLSIDMFCTDLDLVEQYKIMCLLKIMKIKWFYVYRDLQV